MKVDLQNICKSFGTVVANVSISLSFGEGKIIGLLGENGAGKSTLARILSGNTRQDSGEILLDGQRVSFNSPAQAIRCGVGMLHQDPSDFPALSVLENFLIGREGSIIPNRSFAGHQLRELAGRFGFNLQPDMLVGRLTVGERQQLEIVRLLASKVKVFILDEPTTGISLAQKKSLFAALQILAKEGMTAIFISHKLEEIEELCSEAAVLRKGRLVGQVLLPCPTQTLVLMMFGQEGKIGERMAAVASFGESPLEWKNVSVTDRRLALVNISIYVQPGEIVALAGVEGSGQELFLRACAGMTRPTTGTIKVAGQTMQGKDHAGFLEQGVAFLPGNRLEEGLVPGMSLVEHVILIRSSGIFVDKERATIQSARLISRFRIVGQPKSPVQTLSGGNQQRLLLALLPESLRVLLLENPTRGLDLESIFWVWSLLEERRSSGTTILFCSSDLDEILRRSDRVVVFCGGKIVSIVQTKDTNALKLGYLIGGEER